MTETAATRATPHPSPRTHRTHNHTHDEVHLRQSVRTIVQYAAGFALEYEQAAVQPRGNKASRERHDRRQGRARSGVHRRGSATGRSVHGQGRRGGAIGCGRPKLLSQLALVDDGNPTRLTDRDNTVVVCPAVVAPYLQKSRWGGGAQRGFV